MRVEVSKGLRSWLLYMISALEYGRLKGGGMIGVQVVGVGCIYVRVCEIPALCFAVTYARFWAF